MLINAIQKCQDSIIGTRISLEGFEALYPIFHFDVCICFERLKDFTMDIDFQRTTAPAEDKVFYTSVISVRFMTLDVLNGKQ
ncbi:hypothetical protein ACJMK2_033752 [Sinanodonta woodiana]|uniref:Uncharacterized protein n=1 Tax=Sinanodonta woodiana TaxID=1069815 RepID=A0ABD3WPB7_SINWO